MNVSVVVMYQMRADKELVMSYALICTLSNSSLVPPYSLQHMPLLVYCIISNNPYTLLICAPPFSRKKC